MEIFTLIEEYDKFNYNSKTIVVPKNYITKKLSLNKHRALNYFSEWLLKNGYGKETYVVHLDDDTIVSEKYLQYVMGMEEVAGGGSIRLREFKHFILTTIAEFGRVADYDSWVAFFTIRHKPIGVNSEGLVIRADVESKIGWDYGPVSAEDLVMGQNIYSRGYSYGFIPGFIYLAPALTALDFYRQRRRWIDHFFISLKDVWKMRKSAVLWFVFLYSFGWSSMAGLIIWCISILIGFHLNIILLSILSYDLIISFAVRQYGASTVKDIKYNIVALIMQIPIVIFESGTFFYFIFRRPKTTKDYTIKKV